MAMPYAIDSSAPTTSARQQPSCAVAYATTDVRALRLAEALTRRGRPRADPANQADTLTITWA
jgi:hypothetical protein